MKKLNYLIISFILVAGIVSCQNEMLQKTDEKIVHLGISDGDNVEILDGISKKDIVITNYHD